MNKNTTPLFSQSAITNLLLKNRLVVAPMTRVSGNKDGTVGPLMKSYYESFASGGFGLIISEGIYTDKQYSQAYKNQTGLTDSAQMSSWKNITQAVQKNGAKIIAQLMHAGALSQYNKYRDRNAAPSAVKPLGKEMTFYYGEGEYATPVEMNQEDIDDVIIGFAQAASYAKQAGFDGVEIHGANGYLLDQFLTLYTNNRIDTYGGELMNRLNLYKEIITAIRAAVGKNFVIGVRFSQSKVNDNEYKWPGKLNDAKQTFEYMRSLGVDYLHTTEANVNSPAFDNSSPLSELAKKYSELPVIANGGVVDKKGANELLTNQGIELVSIGKAALANPDWPNAVKLNKQLKTFSFAMFDPIANLTTAQEYFRTITTSK